MTAYSEAVRDLAAQLAERCRDEDRVITVDGSVRPSDAAALLGKSPRTLENWRLADDRRLPWRRGVGMLRYNLQDIAAAMLDHEFPRDPAKSRDLP